MADLTLLWIRRCLRLKDNPALQAAITLGQPILPVFIWAPEEEAPWQPGGATKWWLHHSLNALQQDLTPYGQNVHIFKGEPLKTFEALISQLPITNVVYDELPEPALIEQQNKVETFLRSKQIKVNRYQNNLLFDHSQIQNKSGKPYQVYTPFSKSCFLLMEGMFPEVEQPLNKLTALVLSEEFKTKLSTNSVELDTLNLLPKIKWDTGFYQRWEPGEKGAIKRLNEFIQTGALKNYKDARDFPILDRGISGLSPHLHFGEISPLRAWQTIREAVSQKVLMSADAFPYLRQLLWREFAHHLLHYFPETTLLPLRKEFNNFEWNDSKELLKKWQTGNTGIPIVDAGMRELWATGWMHNRVRMIVASLLTKNMLIPWQEGAKYFWDTLVDADLANNTLGWQWVAGCGADAAPYFRIFNPVLQSLKFDEKAEYIRKWVPELKNAPSSKNIHSPWVEPLLFNNYSEPIVDIYGTRDEALKRYKMLKKESAV